MAVLSSGHQPRQDRLGILGELCGWDEDFPVQLVQDESNAQKVGDLLNDSINEDFRLSGVEMRDYRDKIARIAHDQPIVQPNGIFELYNVKEDDADYILAALRRENFVEYAQKSAERYDFSQMPYRGIPSRYFKILGKIRIS